MPLTSLPSESSVELFHGHVTSDAAIGVIDLGRGAIRLHSIKASYGGLAYVGCLKLTPKFILPPKPALPK